MSKKSLLVTSVIVLSIAAVIVWQTTLVGQTNLRRARVPFIDADLCTGCELCCETVPTVFCMEGDVATVCDPYGADEEEIQEAIDNCPVEAISWQEE